MVVKSEDDDFELLTKVQNVVLDLQVLLLEGDYELIHNETRQQVLLNYTQSVFEVGQQKYRTTQRVELVTYTAWLSHVFAIHFSPL